MIYVPLSMHRFEPKCIIKSAWIDHLAFAYDIVEAVRPELLVELGTHKGLSYFAFCQSMVENDIEGLAYAVDNWEGEEHAGKHESQVYQEVMKHNREYYRAFSYPLKMYFHEALNHFDNDTIDLLHIDGLHTYDAVKEDFSNWYPKVKPGGIILFHDICARIKDFGVWKFWEELQEEHQCFSFHHGFGLGVLRKPGGYKPDHPLLQLLFDSPQEEHGEIRKIYSLASEFLECKRKTRRLIAGQQALNSQK